MTDSFDGFCSLWPGADSGGMDEGMYSPHQLFFDYVFDKYNFSIISNLFNDNKPYALAHIIENVRTQCIILYLVKYSLLKIIVKKFKQSLPEKCSKNTKIAITACNISKFFLRSMPRTPLKPFLYFNLLQLALLKKTIRLKKMVKLCSPPFFLNFLLRHCIAPP